MWCYQTSVRPRQIKGWARHEVKVDRYCLTSGELMVLLHDDRADSPTRGVTQRVMLSPEGDRQVIIPVGVWHMIINLRDEDAELINFPTEPYHHDRPGPDPAAVGHRRAAGEGQGLPPEVLSASASRGRSSTSVRTPPGRP